LCAVIIAAILANVLSHRRDYYRHSNLNMNQEPRSALARLKSNQLSIYAILITMLPRVLILHNRYPIEGGEETVCRTDFKLLQDYGHEVELVEKSCDEYFALSAPNRMLNQIWSGSSYHWFQNKLEAYRPDVVHVHNTYPALSPSVLYAAKKSGVAVVQTLHNFRLLCPQGSFYRDGQSCRECLGKAIPWPAVLHNCNGSRQHSLAITAATSAHNMASTWQNCVDLFIAPSDIVRDLYIEAGWKPQTIVVKPHACYPDPEVGAVPQDREPFVLFAGRLDQMKGLDTVLQAWQNSEVSSRWQLKIAGDLTALNDAGTMHNVDTLGRRSHQEVLDLMRRASAFLFASKGPETFGMTIVEAFACGTPVIASNVASNNGLVQDGMSALVFAPGDVQALSNRLVQLAGSDELRLSLARSGRLEFENNYAGSIVYSQMLSIYRQAMALSSKC
jgi:glycosyltransferase involved in cell wall biosynthesis